MNYQNKYHNFTRVTTNALGQFTQIRFRAVVAIETGGHAPAAALAHRLDLPLQSISIRYPVSIALSKAPRWKKPFIWLTKELWYKTSHPVVQIAQPAIGNENSNIPTGPIILVDDRASSGKTLSKAIALLTQHGIQRREIYVTVVRCGKRARPFMGFGTP